MTTKTQLKTKIDAILAEIDTHSDLNRKQRAAIRSEVTARIMLQLEAMHDEIPAYTKVYRAMG